MDGYGGGNEFFSWLEEEEKPRPTREEEVNLWFLSKSQWDQKSP